MLEYRIKLSKCLHPRKVVNKYTGDVVTTSCGVCEACALNRARSMAFQGKLETAKFKYNYFITLTYNNDNIPTFIPAFDDNLKYTTYITRCDRHLKLIKGQLGVSSAGIGMIPYSLYNPDKFKLLQSKCKLNGSIPYLFYYDVQSYFKRIRKEFQKIDSTQKISYFICGEYGPVHFRPHYHIVLSHNSDTLHEAWYKIVCEKWRFGRVDASIVRQNVSNYVSSYVNSHSSLPKVFSVCGCKPFCRHSNSYGFKLSQREIQRVYNQKPCEFIKRSASIDGGVISYTPWRSFEANFFPRCREFARKSYGELYRSYSIYQTASKIYGKYLTVSNLALRIYKSFFGDHPNVVNSYFLDALDIRKFHERHKYNDWSKPDYWWLNQIKNELYFSKRFIEVICNGDFSLLRSRLDTLINYYKYKELSKLSFFYETQSLYASQTNNLNNIMFFYDNTLVPYHGEFILSDVGKRLFFNLNGLKCDNIFKYVNFEDSPFYDHFSKHIKSEYKKSIKHKYQNDLNKIFL